MESTITTGELKSLINCVCIIDIRDEEDYCCGHIPTATNIPFEKLLANYKIILRKKTKYYIYCDCGKLSGRVVDILAKDGYKVVSVEGGYENWCRENKIC